MLNCQSVHCFVEAVWKSISQVKILFFLFSEIVIVSRDFQCFMSRDKLSLICRMPLSKAKRYSRFNVGEVMKARKQNREDFALAHTSVVKAKNIVNALNSRKRRLENKVIAVPLVLNYDRQSFYGITHIKLASLLWRMHILVQGKLLNNSQFKIFNLCRRVWPNYLTPENSNFVQFACTPKEFQASSIGTMEKLNGIVQYRPEA